MSEVICKRFFLTNSRLAIPRKVDPAEVTHAVIPVDKMPALSAYSANCTTRLVVDVGRAGADDIGRAGRRVIGRLEVGGWAQATSER